MCLFVACLIIVGLIGAFLEMVYYMVLSLFVGTILLYYACDIVGWIARKFAVRSYRNNNIKRAIKIEFWGMNIGYGLGAFVFARIAAMGVIRHVFRKSPDVDVLATTWNASYIKYFLIIWLIVFLIFRILGNENRRFFTDEEILAGHYYKGLKDDPMKEHVDKLRLGIVEPTTGDAEEKPDYVVKLKDDDDKDVNIVINININKNADENSLTEDDIEEIAAKASKAVEESTADKTRRAMGEITRRAQRRQANITKALEELARHVKKPKK